MEQAEMQTLVQQLIDSIDNGSLEVAIGFVLLIISGLARFLTSDAKGKVGEWSSAITGLVAGIGAAMAAGSLWYYSLLIGGIASSSSSGFWKLIKSIITRASKKKEM